MKSERLQKADMALNTFGIRGYDGNRRLVVWEIIGLAKGICLSFRG